MGHTSPTLECAWGPWGDLKLQSSAHIDTKDKTLETTCHMVPY